MNFKKLAITGATAAVLLGSAIPAFANHSNRGLSVDIDNDNAYVKNVVYTKADTGDNEIRGRRGGVRNSDINTGDAWASSTVYNTVNQNVIDLCGCLNRRGGVKVEIDNDDATVKNYVTTKADTGDNSIYGKRVRRSDITTGNAGAEAYVDSVVNSNIFGGGSEE